MKTLKTILAIIILSLFTISCSKEEIQTPNTAVYLISKISYTANQNTKFFYDENNKLINEESLYSDGSVIKTTFDYNSKGKIVQTLSKPIAGKNTSIEKLTYTYDAQDRLIEKKLFTTTTSFPDEFTYDSKGIYSYSPNNVEVKYVYANSNFAYTREIYESNPPANYLTSKRYRNISIADPNGILDWTSTYEYDDKKNPLSNLPDEYVFLQKTKNNQTKRTTPEFSPSVETKTYEYNQEGYPTKSISGNSITTFEYIVK
jgi:YD repeat-containing protein